MYTEEFRHQAVDLISAEQLTIADAARRLGWIRHTPPVGQEVPLHTCDFVWLAAIDIMLV